MHAISKPAPQIQKPGDSGMRRFRHRARHIEVKHRFRPRPDLRPAPPTGVTATSRTISTHSLTSKIHVNIFIVGQGF